MHSIVTKLKFLIFSFLICYCNTSTATPTDTLNIQNQCLSVHNQWMDLIIELTKNTPGYTAPVASRTYNYLSIGMYEASLGLLPGNYSLENQIYAYKKPQLDGINIQSYPSFVNAINYYLVLHFFKNMSPTYKLKVESLFKKLNKHCFLRKKNDLDKEVKSLVQAILSVAKSDGASNAWNNNFPSDYTPPNCDACWVKTSPGYISALQPYWGDNKLMIRKNRVISENIPFLPFSTDTNSAFYTEVDTIFKMYKKLDQHKINTAKYWDDAAGVSGTPVGHLYHIACQTAKNQNLDLQKTVELYTLLGISLNDAVIESWRLKYSYNLIRPITYIQKHISPQFSTPIPTPPFPEFPSGHSYQAGASNQVFNYIFGDKLSISDNANERRVDINGAVRNFPNFNQMAEEMSISRFFGGIHYLHTLTISLEYGRRIGKNTLSSIKLH